MTRITGRPSHSQLEIHATYSRAGFRTWSVLLRDLYFGARQLDTFYSKREAVAAAERLSRKRHIPIERRRQQKPEACLRERKKFAAYQKRQQRVAQRAARRARIEMKT